MYHKVDGGVYLQYFHWSLVSLEVREQKIPDEVDKSQMKAFFRKV